MSQINDKVRSMKCIKCHTNYPFSDYFEGCPACASSNRPASVTLKYNKSGCTSYNHLLPYTSHSILGEGNTPMLRHEKLEKDFNLEALYIKNEFQNPTGSHKDRMSKYVVLRAKELGAKGVIAASSGNAGVSLAVYAARAGLDCIIVSTDDMSSSFRKRIRSTGAQLHITKTSDKRWDYVKKRVTLDGWYPATNYVSPPVGSNPIGVQGYKNIAYEIYEHNQNSLPTDILIPVSRGDLLWGIYEGFCDLLELNLITKLPRLTAIEPIPRLEKVLEGANYTDVFDGDYTLMPSIGGRTVTYQSLLAVTESKGTAISINNEALTVSIKTLRQSGILLESSSSVVYAATKKLFKTGFLSKESKLLWIATSSSI